ncbi:MAG: tRNA (adenosine(37)-N6)-threonylcarbamoyltransferase complex dimerization subunit type 1 TsaB [Elusimicrobia bacterium]|nr:tRNA (adenosine(37)-N6)-threonylcarbamoyltransferase complex dimerization subunit type 1 TsaB [Elusimicrobiota bacterium]
MNLLAIDTTGPALGLALRAGERILTFQRELAAPHDETLLPRAERLLARARLGWEDLQALAAASGPGRFTGIRIGMAFCAVMGGRLSIPVLPVSRLEALAARAADGEVCAVLPGYRDEVFYQLFKNRGATPRPAAAPVWCSAEDWSAVRGELAARGVAFAEGEVLARDLLAHAEELLRRGHKPRFEPLYLKPASYERPAGRPR